MSGYFMHSLAFLGSLVGLLLQTLPGVCADDVAIFSLGNRRPEGIHIPPPEANEVMGLGNGTFALVSDLFFGSVRAVNLASGDIAEIVPVRNFTERLAVGMWYSEGAIFVCGGGPLLDPSLTAVVYVYNATTGEDIVSCASEGSLFLNDVVVVDGTAYITDSGMNSIITLDVAAAIGGECVLSSIETPPEYFGLEGFNANGIIDYESGLIIGTIANASLFYLDLTDGAVSPILPPGLTTPFADGLARAGNTLYVTENELNRISVWNLASTESGSVTAELEGYLLSDAYDIPATCEVSGDVVYAVNARFSTLPFPAENEFNLAVFNETFDLVGVDRNVITSDEDLPMNPMEEEIVESSVDEGQIDEEGEGFSGDPVRNLQSSANAIVQGYFIAISGFSMVVASLV